MHCIALHCLFKVQVRSRYAEMFNVMLYVAFMLREALHHTQRKCTEICSAWNRMVSDLAAAKAEAAAEVSARARDNEAHKRFLDENNVYKEQVQTELADLRFKCKVLPLHFCTIAADLSTLNAAPGLRERHIFPVLLHMCGA
jgi:hypothetical protein